MFFLSPGKRNFVHQTSAKRLYVRVHWSTCWQDWGAFCLYRVNREVSSATVKNSTWIKNWCQETEPAVCYITSRNTCWVLSHLSHLSWSISILCFPLKYRQRARTAVSVATGSPYLNIYDAGVMLSSLIVLNRNVHLFVATIRIAIPPFRASSRCGSWKRYKQWACSVARCHVLVNLLRRKTLIAISSWLPMKQWSMGLLMKWSRPRPAIYRFQ